MAAMRAKAKKIVKSKSALLLVASPMCAAFSRLQHLNKNKLTEDKKRELLEEGIKQDQNLRL